ncbi:MAG: hypothetical protein DWH79_00285 [Planctomycetota bacterium]|nr:MAG: hypothetical protein DWH79_00285 [Planctomycetota bacterium]
MPTARSHLRTVAPRSCRSASVAPSAACGAPHLGTTTTGIGGCECDGFGAGSGDLEIQGGWDVRRWPLRAGVLLVGATLATLFLASSPLAADESRPRAARQGTLPAEAEEAAPPVVDAVAFLRVSRDARRRPQSLDTSIVHYRETAESARAAGRSRPLEVDLVGAVHLGSRAYYDTLDRLFEDYDAVLYELVAPDNARVPKPGRKSGGAIGTAQSGMTKMLGLEFQLDQIDYSAENFVHADMSPKEFDAAMARRGESWWTMFTRLMSESVERSQRGKQTGPEVGFGDLWGLFFGKDREVKLRRIMAEQFTDMEVLTAAFGGEDGSTLITDRNGAAIEVLSEQIAAGQERMAIFYGAAHMDDFDHRLRNDFSMEPVEVEWLEAWDLRIPGER